MLASGDSTLVISPNGRKILIDGGEKEQNILLPYLLARKIKTLDYVFVSHLDSDHVGEILYLMNEIKIKKILIGKQFEKSENLKEFIKIANNKKIKVITCQLSSRINIEKDLFFEILWPDENEKIEENTTNNNALVFKMVYGKFSMLFTGDIEEPAEKILANKYKNKLKANVLKVAHHGSNSSSTNDLLKYVRPNIALIGVGENNTYGHPNEEVIKRLNDINCKIYRTDKNGEIEIIVDNKRKIKILTN